MSIYFRRLCGLDAHKETVVACVLAPDGRTGKLLKKVQGTFRGDLGAHARVADAVESDGPFWPFVPQASGAGKSERRSAAWAASRRFWS
ncbi:MAG: hypothetical protein ABI165_07545 [Bryobacteraceae bacterium]